MYFTYNDISSESMKIKIIEFSPPGKAEENAETIAVPGRATEITNKLGRYMNIKKVAKFALFESSIYRSVLEWLSGSGKLIFSDESDKYYNVYMTGAAEVERICNGVLEFEIKVIFEPFAHALGAESISISTTYTAVENSGTIYSEPVITFKVTADAEPVLKGDVNFDGVVDARDASLVMNEYITVQAGGESTLTDAQKEAADMNNDGLIDARDASLILDAYTNSQSGSTSSSESSSEKQVTIYVNDEALIIGLPSAVVRNGFTVTVDSTNMLIYYTNGDGEKINIMQYSYGDLPLLHTGTNYIKYSGDVDSMSITVNERWL